MSEAAQVEVVERRGRQRFIAKGRGEPCFWALLDGQRVALLDLSIDGFSIPVGTPPASHHSFDFILQRANAPDEICGTARVVNYLGAPAGGQAGCRFESFEGDGGARLEDWLATLVLDHASLPITEADAECIVRGPSLV